MSITNIAISISIGAVIGAVVGGIATKSLKGAFYGMIAGASLVSLTILAYLQGGGGFGGFSEAFDTVIACLGYAVVGGLLAVLEKYVNDTYWAKDNDTKYNEAFLRGVAAVCTAFLIKKSITYGLKNRAASDRIVAWILDRERGDDILPAIAAASLELTVGIGSGRIFKHPWEVMEKALISAGTTYLVKRWAFNAANAKGESETAIRIVSGFIAGRVHDIIRRS